MSWISIIFPGLSTEVYENTKNPVFFIPPQQIDMLDNKILYVEAILLLKKNKRPKIGLIFDNNYKFIGWGKSGNHAAPDQKYHPKMIINLATAFVRGYEIFAPEKDLIPIYTPEKDKDKTPSLPPLPPIPKVNPDVQQSSIFDGMPLILDYPPQVYIPVFLMVASFSALVILSLS